MSWNRATWYHNDYKHAPIKLSIAKWADQRNDTKGRKGNAARYAPDIRVQELEMSVVEHNRDPNTGQINLIRGRQINQGSFGKLYMICGHLVGAYDGEDTDIVFVEWYESEPCSVHGRPMSDTELKRLLRRNPPELEWYEQRRREMKAQRLQ